MHCEIFGICEQGNQYESTLQPSSPTWPLLYYPSQIIASDLRLECHWSYELIPDFQMTFSDFNNMKNKTPKMAVMFHNHANERNYAFAKRWSRSYTHFSHTTHICVTKFGHR